MPESTLYIMCGLPFSGKTALARALADQCGFVHLDLDAIARSKGLSPEEGIDDEQWDRVFREVHRQAAALLASGKSVVFDAVNYDRVGRDRLRKIAQQSGGTVHILYMQLSLQEIDSGDRRIKPIISGLLSEIKILRSLPRNLRSRPAKKISWSTMERSL